MIKYVCSSSIDLVLFQLGTGNIPLHNYKYQAERDKNPWEKVFKIVIEEES